MASQGHVRAPERVYCAVLLICTAATVKAPDITFFSPAHPFQPSNPASHGLAFWIYSLANCGWSRAPFSIYSRPRSFHRHLQARENSAYTCFRGCSWKFPRRTLHVSISKTVHQHEQCPCSRAGSYWCVRPAFPGPLNAESWRMPQYSNTTPVQESITRI